jgi:hypothetical protein
MSTAKRWGWCALAIALALAAAGCGTEGAPQPPSLNLPDKVTDLAAVRAGGQVSLSWTMPTKNTDKLLLKGDVAVRVCRRLDTAEDCATAGTLELAPGAEGRFVDALPAALAAGNPRVLTYSVELENRKGRSAGLSNAAPVLAGRSPAAITGLKAEVRKEGVVLSWNTASEETDSMAVRLDRKLLTPPAQAKSQQGFLAQPAEPIERSLLVEAGASPAGRALDREIQFGNVYEYRVQRVIRVDVNGKTLELAGELSPPVRVEAQDIFPPAVPTGLAAVATEGGNEVETAIDLSWQPVSDADVAGYILYRREAGGEWARISPAEPVVAPAFHDAHVKLGHTYEYSVSAIGRNGHESARSALAEETVPSP